MFKHYKVEVVLDMNGPLYSQIEEYANSKGACVEEELEGLVTLGLCSHIRGNLDWLIRCRKAREYQGMRDAGIITEDEFDAKMDELIRLNAVSNE